MCHCIMILFIKIIINIILLNTQYKKRYHVIILLILNIIINAYYFYCSFGFSVINPDRTHNIILCMLRKFNLDEYM